MDKTAHSHKIIFLHLFLIIFILLSCQKLLAYLNTARQFCRRSIQFCLLFPHLIVVALCRTGTNGLSVFRTVFPEAMPRALAFLRRVDRILSTTFILTAKHVLVIPLAPPPLFACACLGSCHNRRISPIRHTLVGYSHQIISSESLLLLKSF